MDRNLLIIGAGAHGKVVKETADAMGIFGKISFLDDLSHEAIGKLEELDLFKEDFTHGFVALGNNLLRATWFNKLSQVGMDIPALIHPEAYISPSTVIGEGTIILPKAAVHTHVRIESFSIIGVGALIDHDAVVEEFCHIDTGAVIGSYSKVPKFSKIEAGIIYNTI